MLTVILSRVSQQQTRVNMFSLKHVSHCLVLLTLCYLTTRSMFFFKNNFQGISALTTRSNYVYYFILILSYLGVLQKLFMVTIGIAGLMFYECFPGPVQMKANLSKLPRLSFRIVTRGDYPKLITKNTNSMKNLCSELGLKNFIIEIVTEKEMDLPLDLVQIVVPQSYKTKNGTMFKARNLQYCLEEGVSCLSDEDWIIHLDEDSVLTTEALNGIVNFIHEGKYCLGEGEISYDPDNLTGTLTQILVAIRVICDKGLFKVPALALKEFPFCMKGSFVICKNCTEKEVSFDGGVNASILEFIYFSYKAFNKGYQKGWVEGQVLEQGTLTVNEYLNQVTRVSTGLNYVGKSDVIRGVKGWIMFLLTRTVLQGHALYLMSLLITLFASFQFQNGIFLTLMGLIIAYDIYVGMFYLYQKYDHLSIWKSVFYFLVNLLIGAFFFNVVSVIAHFVSCVQKEPQFKITKKAD